MTRGVKTSSSLLVILVFLGCATSWVKPPQTRPVQGIASWYGEEFAGRVTASGEIFDPLDLTAAHRALPFGTIAAVTNLQTGETVEVRINDRGPYIGKRIIDLSYGAAQKIGLVRAGIGLVELKIITLGTGKRIPSGPVIPPAGAEEPPKVPFPLPAEVRSPTVAQLAEEEGEFELEVIEERSGMPTRKQVSADGRELEIVAADGTRISPAPAPMPEQFILQLGAFQNEDNAETLRDRAAKILPRVYIEESLGFYRVRTGPFATREEALKVQEELTAVDLPSLLLTQ